MSPAAPAGRRGDLPTGVVTFLFSDVEGSTRLLQALGDAFPPALEEQARLMRAAIAAGDGIEVGTEGDSFFAVFAAPAGAVRAAVAAQRALASAEWPDDASVRVRIGIHTGEGRRGGDNYVGLDVHRAARIASAAHGGQVLLSEETKVLVERALPTVVRLRDLGEHRLKDLERPERLFQLVIDGLPADFPPLRSLDAPRGNLPQLLTSFVGRERETAELRELLGDRRLVTLTGTGGAGKTRLAIGVARAVSSGFPDGAFFVALDTVREAGLVPSLIAQAIGLIETKELAPVDAVRQHLRERRVLLVLDNVEQIAGAGAVVEDLLKAAPETRILVTSRSPLHVYGEQQYPVPPLSLPDLDALPDLAELRRNDAVCLFVDRARIARPGFDLTADNARTIAAITARLDGLPLAIELAAARAKLLSPQALLSRLERRLDVLAASFGDMPARQRTLRGAIEWSHEALAEPERVLLRRFSVFAGGAGIEAAGAVCNADGAAGDDLLEPLSNLVDGSLMLQGEDHDGEPRFGLLETIREYAHERLVGAGEADSFTRRHAEHLAELAEAAEPRLLGRDHVSVLDRLTGEHDNIRAALRWAAAEGDTTLGLRIAAAIWRFWQERSHIREGRHWITALLAKADAEVDPVVHAKAITAAGNLAYWQGAFADAGGYYERALAIGRELGDPAKIGDGLRNLGFIAMASRDVPRAKELFGEAVTWLEKVGDRFALAEGRASFGMSQVVAGDFVIARGLLEGSHEIMVELGVLPRAADNAIALGLIHRRLGDLAEARRLTREGVELTARIGDESRGPIMLDAAAAFVLARGQAPEAVRLAAAAAHLRATIGGNLPTFFLNIDLEMAAARQQLGEAAFASAWADGEALSADRALGYALEVIDRDGPA